ncbi:MAG: SRPBCC family protein [Paracoccaceae bacterium]
MGQMMTAKANEFHIVTRWRIEALADEVAAILTDAQSLPDWWGEVYLAVQIADPGDANGVGRKVSVRSKGRLPYQINWVARLVAADLPHGWEVEATGDLQGRGVWRLTQNGPITEAVYDWRVKAERPLFRLLSPVLGPLFAWNHRWAMARGEAGLRREVIRRRLRAA